jgi:hypothetical protein
MDGTVPPPDGPAPPDGAPPPDGVVPPPGDALPPLDGSPDQAVPSCLVTFTVKGVRWDAPEGGVDAQVTGRAVRLVGDAANIGSWTPTAGAVLTETSPGTWSGTVTFRDQQLTEFKFVKLDGITPEWETWTPFDSNRSFYVECFADGGAARDAADAGTDADAFGVADGSGDRAADGDAAMNDASGDTQDGPRGDAGAFDADTNAQDSGATGDGRVVAVPARGRSYVGDFGVRPPDATK